MTEDHEEYDNNIYYQFLLEQADSAWGTVIPGHLRTQVGSTETGQAIMKRVICEGSGQEPSHVEIIEIAGDQKIKGTCVASRKCGVSLTWDIGSQEWQVEDGPR